VKIGDGLNINAEGLLSFDKNEITILKIAKNGEIIHPDENKLVNITLNKIDVGLGNVDNTSDLNKPVSIYQQEALDTKLNKYVGIENSGKMLVVDGNGQISYRQMLHQFVTKNDGKLISTDTLEYDYSDLFVVTTTNGTEIKIDGAAELRDTFIGVTYDSYSGVLKFNRFNGTSVDVDLPLELIIKGGRYDEDTAELVLILANNEEIRVPLSGLIDTYKADDITLQLVDGVFGVRKNSITNEYLTNNSVTDVNIVSVSGSKVVGPVDEAVRATQDEHGNNISTTYRKITDGFNKSEIEELLADKADKTQLPLIRRWGGF
jgi:hypothetical protein